MFFYRLILLFLSTFFLMHSVQAELRYQQTLTMLGWHSQEDMEKRVQEFCSIAEEVPDMIKVIGVEYNKKKIGKKDCLYRAVITCHVAEKDKTLVKIEGIIFQKKGGLVTFSEKSSL